MAKGHTYDKWHQILGHVNPWTVKTLLKNNLVTGLEVDKSQAPTQCTACIQAKRHVEPFPQQATEKAEERCNLVVSDIWGPAQVEGPGHVFTCTPMLNPDIQLSTLETPRMKH